MMAEATKLDAAPYTVQYELLRSQIIGAVARGNAADQRRGLGLALLLSEGLPGWLKIAETMLRISPAPRAVGSPGPSPHEDCSQCSAAPAWLSSLQRHEVTTILASLVLSTRLAAREPSMEGCSSW